MTMLGHDPDTLFNLSVDAFGDYIKVTVQNTNLDVERMKWFCGNVHEALGNVTTHSHIANEVTMRLLGQMDTWVDSEAVEDGEDTYRLVMSHLTSALVHPAVTSLNFLENDTLYKIRHHDFFDDYNPFCIYKSVDRLLSQVVTEMNRLKVLQLQNLPFGFEQFSFPNLQELTLLNVCSDRLLEFLSVTCSNLRKLDVSHSLDVTEAGVQFLVKFTLLEKLNVKDTNISEEGLTQLLTDLPKNRVSLLKSFGCYDLKPQHFQLLNANLVELELFEFDENCDISLLRHLEHLESFTVESAHNLEKILEIIGHQLKQLTVLRPLEFETTSVDLHCIFKYCSSLVCLTLFSNCRFDRFETTPHCNFKSLKVVDLTVAQYSDNNVLQSNDFLSFILSQCTNVRVIKVRCWSISSNAVATAMLQNNPLECLEELHWWSDEEPLSPQVGRQIVNHCKNLKVLYGNIWWTRRRSRKPWYGDDGVQVVVPVHYDMEVVVNPSLI